MPNVPPSTTTSSTAENESGSSRLEDASTSSQDHDGEPTALTPSEREALLDRATGLVVGKYHLVTLQEARERLSERQMARLEQEIEETYHALEAREAARRAPSEDRATKKGIRSLRTPFGHLTPVTGVLLVIIVIVYVAQSIMMGSTVASPDHTPSGIVTPQALHGAYWLLVTAAFVHLSVGHILSNGLSLLVIGGIAETLYGSLRYLGIYLGAGLVGNLLVALAGQAGAGASGAIFGIVGALLVGAWRNQAIIGEAARRGIVRWLTAPVLLNVAISFLPGISLLAHAGGFITGATLALIIPFRSPGETVRLRRAMMILSSIIVLVNVGLAATILGR